MEDRIHKPHYFTRQSLLFSIPLWCLLAAYAIIDPFRVMRSYDDISAGLFIMLNKEHAGTEIYTQHAAERRYDAFLLGTSRTLAFRIADWRDHLPEGASPFVFDANKETLYGLSRKVAFLDESGAAIRDVLIVICLDGTFKPMTNSTGQLYIKDPQISGESGFRFQKTFLESWLAELYFVKYLDYALFRTYRPYMKEVLTLNGNNLIDPVTAERVMPIEQKIQADPDAFYTARRTLFVRRDTLPPPPHAPLITKEHLTAMLGMRRVFAKHGTRYHLVISPLYDQRAIAPRDLHLLRTVFGAERVHDRSGVNTITANERNYIETSHYRAHVGRAIMDELYGPGRHTDGTPTTGGASLP